MLFRNLFAKSTDQKLTHSDGLNDYNSAGHINHLGDPLLQDLCIRWDKKRMGRRAPTQQDMNPRELAHLAPHLLIITARQNPMSLVCDWLGEEVAYHVGKGLTGSKIFPHEESAFQDASRLWALTCLSTEILLTATQLKPHYAKGGYSDSEKRIASVQRLVLPLSDDGLRVSSLIAGVVFDGVVPLQTLVLPGKVIPAGIPHRPGRDCHA